MHRCLRGGSIIVRAAAPGSTAAGRLMLTSASRSEPMSRPSLTVKGEIGPAQQNRNGAINLVDQHLVRRRHTMIMIGDSG